MTPPIRRIFLYQHGLGYFERRGFVTGPTLRLEFDVKAMDDVLKSLVVLSLSGGEIHGLAFETPPDRNPQVSKPALELSSERSLTGLLSALRGQRVRVDTAAEAFEAEVLGVELEDENHLERARVSFFLPESRQVRTLKLEQLERFEVLDPVAGQDLEFALREARKVESRSSATLHLSSGEHDLQVAYIAPAPAWRVSYRLLAEASMDKGGTDVEARGLLLQGYALFDNTLDEDLEDVELRLMAGMPVSFRYALHAPNTPERPLVQDERRTVSAPLEFEGMAYSVGEVASGAASMDWMEAAPMGAPRARSAPKLAAPAPMSSAALEQSVSSVAQGSEAGALFSYTLPHPVSVGRGQSALVPLMSHKLEGRHELLYNGQKHPRHPIATLRFLNKTGLTLERGPMTVLEDGVYAGEAVLPFTVSGSEVIAAFAVELGIKISESQGYSSQLERISIHNEYLLLEEYALRERVYTLENTLEKAVVVTLEERVNSHYTLFDSETPFEQNAEFVRWKVAVESRSSAVFTVKDRTLNRRYESVRSLNGEALSRYLEHRLLGDVLAEGLADLLERYRRLDALEQQRQKLDREREKVYGAQKQIQGNLAPLGQGGEEGKLRSRLVRDLEKHENRLGQFEEMERTHTAEVTALEGEIAGLLERLNTSS